MTTHLFKGRNDGDSTVVTSIITLCCGVASLGLPKGDQGTVSPQACDCSQYEKGNDHE